MPADYYSRVWPFFIAALAVLLIYRRLRRSFGRQPVRRTLMSLRIVLLVLVGASLLSVALKSGAFFAGEVAGLAAGLGLALWGASRTRYERSGDQLYYIPHTYSGIAVTLLVLGRFVYRLVQMYTATHEPGAPLPSGTAQGFASPQLMQSPMTVGLIFVLIGYYVCYYGVVLWKSKHIGAADLEVSAPNPGGGAA